jgi:hypothetical protein
MARSQVDRLVKVDRPVVAGHAARRASDIRASQFTGTRGNGFRTRGGVALF